jgi:mediator of RNA polymerase II transcription subunit 17
LAHWIRQAQNEALTALDFISLLLSKEVPRAEASMSPLLKNSVPTSALDFDRTLIAQPTQAQEDEAKAVTHGWNLTALNSSADRLLGAAEKLEKEITKETKYWEQIRSVSEKGWATCRLPRERHTVGVRFGFSEAGPLFARRGLAALRPDANGDIMLDHGLSDNAKIIQVRVMKNGVSSETSGLGVQKGASGELEAVIGQARDSLFDEELFHEITREARTLLSWGVTVQNEAIHLPISISDSRGRDNDPTSKQEIVLELLPRQAQTTTFRTKNTTRSDTILLALRTLMTGVYRERFKTRSKAPKPLTDEKVVAPIHHILPPLMTYLSHDHATAMTMSILNKMTALLGSAGMTTAPPSLRHDLDIQKLSSGATTSELMKVLEGSMQSTITFDFPVTGRHTIQITTQMSAPLYGTAFTITTAVPSPTATNPTSNIHDSNNLNSHIAKLCQTSVLKYIVHKHPSWHEITGTTGIVLKTSTDSGQDECQLAIMIEDGLLALVLKIMDKTEIVAVWNGTFDALGKTILERVHDVTTRYMLDE